MTTCLPIGFCHPVFVPATTQINLPIPIPVLVRVWGTRQDPYPISHMLQTCAIAIAWEFRRRQSPATMAVTTCILHHRPRPLLSLVAIAD
ncbi:hypothetical protein GUJ93_ZPchr0001g30106 [Zizania palustris]|uniref:Uncharacterized protein n=1 Tax=Zizania palustris TaxID=103762 RepID=A0A8J5V2A1_ZIZPA|nr:hypothetical protein GUJ93_ZPchr0001g30106 [Zizania palustris]